MSPSAHRMFAEVLGRQLGVDAGELESMMGSDPIAAVFALSMMGQQPEKADTAPARLARIAAMVGACPVCVGEDAFCVECGGNGKPGSRQPDREALLQWIARPLRRVGLAVAASGGSTEHNRGGDES